MARPHEDVPHGMGISGERRKALTDRLARIRGQVDGLQRMIEEERYCPDILQQFAAVRSALRSTERTLMENHLERCASDAIASGGEAAERARREILELFDRYSG